MTDFNPDRRWFLLLRKINFIRDGQYDQATDTRVKRCLRHGGQKFVLDLLQRSEAELLKIDSFGHVSLNAINETLATMGLKVGQFSASAAEDIREAFRNGDAPPWLGSDEEAHWLKAASWTALANDTPAPHKPGPASATETPPTFG